MGGTYEDKETSSSPLVEKEELSEKVTEKLSKENLVNSISDSTSHSQDKTRCESESETSISCNNEGFKKGWRCGKTLLVLDFDNTLVTHCKNKIISVQYLIVDPTVCQSQGRIESLPTDLKEIFKQQGWEAFTKAAFKHLHAKGVDRKEIEKAIGSVPLTLGMKEVMTKVRQEGGDVIVVSDSNLINVEQGLIGNGVEHLVTKIFTNHSYFTDAGEFIIAEPDENAKSCDFSQRGLCKGDTIDRFLDSQREELGIEYDTVMFAGDGKNDLCASIRTLKKNGKVFARRNFKLAQALKDAGHDFHEWSDGHEILEHLHK